LTKGGPAGPGSADHTPPRTRCRTRDPRRVRARGRREGAGPGRALSRRSDRAGHAGAWLSLSGTSVSAAASSATRTETSRNAVARSSGSRRPSALRLTEPDGNNPPMSVSSMTAAAVQFGPTLVRVGVVTDPAGGWPRTGIPGVCGAHARRGRRGRRRTGWLTVRRAGGGPAARRMFRRTFAVRRRVRSATVAIARSHHFFLPSLRKMYSPAYLTPLPL